MLSHHPSSLSQIWGRRGSRAQRALQHVQQIQLHALTGSPDLPWKWQHVNACWGARPSTPPVADSLEVNFPVAHQLYFLFSVKPPIQTLPDLPVRMLSPGNLSVLLHNEQCHSHQGRDRRGQGLGLVAARLAGWFWLLSKGGGTFNLLGSGMICWVISGCHGSKCLAKYEPQCYQSINQNPPLLPPQINPLISVLIKKSVKADKCLPQR